MKNNILALSIFTLTLSLQTLQASPNCGHNHAPAPEANASTISTRVQLSQEAFKTLKLERTKAEKRKIDEVVLALGTLENIPENTVEISSRVAGKIAEVYVSFGDVVKKGQAICKVESLLAGDPPPSLVLEAPIDGIVENLNVFKSSPLDVNDSLARIVDTKKIYAKASVFQDDFSKLKLGQVARIKIAAMGDEVFKGKLVKFSPFANSDLNSIDVYFELDNADLKLKNNMQAIFSIVISSSEEKLCVENSAIGGEYPDYFVFVEECSHDLIYKKVSLVVGAKNDSYTEVLEGLKEGDILAKNKIYNLQFSPAAPDNHNHDETEAEHNHSHAEFECTAITHSHAHEEELSAWEEFVDYLVHKKDDIVEFSKTGYFAVLVYIALGVSVLLNIVFILAEFISFKRRANN